MAVKVELGHLPYRIAIDIIQWCVDRDIDFEKCQELIHAMGTKPVHEIEWSLEIPDKYITYFLLKWE